MAKYETWQKEEKREEIKEQIIKRGRTKSELAEYMGINRSTFYLWLNEYEDFKQLIEEAEKERIDYICDKIERKLEKEASEEYGFNFKAMTYYLEKMRPEKWGNRKEEKLKAVIDDMTGEV